MEGTEIALAKLNKLRKTEAFLHANINLKSQKWYWHIYLQFLLKIHLVDEG